jgi:hypothetical protein
MTAKKTRNLRSAREVSWSLITIGSASHLSDLRDLDAMSQKFDFALGLLVS